MFSGAALRMSLHRVAGRASRHALSARDRYRCVNAALNLAGAPLATITRRTVHSVPARSPLVPVSSTAGGVLTGMGGGLRRVAPVAHGVLASGARRSIATSRERADVGFFERQVQRSLETRANSASNNVLKQEQYLRELNHSNQPEAVIDRVHSGAVNTNSAGVALEYIKALARTDRLDRSTLAHLMNQSSSSSSAAAGAGRGFAAEAAAAAGARSGDALLVRVAPPSMWQQLLKFGGTIVMIYVVLMIVKSALGGRGNGKGGGLGSMLPGMGDEAGKAVVDEKTRFSDVKGAPEAKDELVEVVQFLKNPSKFTALGGKLPRGVLLVGPPGTGKTLLAKAVAGEAGVPFFYASGSEFEEVFVGLGAMRVRQLFKNAKAHAPCIIFIDEIDAVGQKRTLSVGNSNRQTINQLLSELDGFEGDSGVIVIAATNFAESLDSALTRPGRFDRHVHVQLPDLAARREILELYLDKCPVDATVDANVIARGTPGASGADLANIVNMAAVQASVEDREMLGQSHLEWAKDKIIMGPERKSAVMRPEDLKCTAYHETGHALVAMLTPGSYPIHKATIMPRGQALGMVSQLPEHDVVSMSKKQLLAKLDVLMGGRVAEEVFFGEDEVTTGASSDMQQATTLAVRMVTQYGFTEAGGLAYTESSQLKDMSPEHRAMVDQEVRKILDAAYQRARTLITKNKDKMHLVANALLEHETLTGKELQGLLEGRAIAASE